MLAQIFAIVIFLVMFLMIVLDKYERHIVSLVGAALVIALVFGLGMQSGQAVIDTLNIHSMFKTEFWFGEVCQSPHGKLVDNYFYCRYDGHG